MARILVVDDEPANRLLLTTLLGYAGHNVLEAERGEQALQLAQSEHLDLIVLDLSMPGMHGAQFLKALRAQGAAPAPRVALYTGTVVDAMLRDFMRVHGIAHVIPKPGEPEAILRAVAEALNA